MEWIAPALREYPELAILAAIAIGSIVGPLKLGSFRLGSVPAVLLVGVLIGQLGIPVSPGVKSVFFLVFLFAVGYGVGPQFFRGLTADALPQVLFACVLCLAVLLSTYVAASLAGYHAGLAAGLLSGAATSSGALGMATDTINGLGLPPDRAKAWTDAMPAAYAVTYLFGTAGSAWFLALIGPRLLGVDLVEECKAYERKLGGLKGQEGGLGTDGASSLEIVDVVITRKAVAGKTLRQIEEAHDHQGPGVVLRKLIRQGQELPFTPGTTVDRGDVLQVMGASRDVARAVEVLGYADRSAGKSYSVWLALGILAGIVVGAISTFTDGVPISLWTSGGALLAGLAGGSLRAVSRTFGRIPEPALWAFNNLGLTVFIAVVGIGTGPQFIIGLEQAGVSLLLWGVFVTVTPFVVGILAGKYVFGFHPGILLGACAGARATTAALGAIQDAAQSKVPALGYTVAYAVGNMFLIAWGGVIVLMMR